MSTITTRGTAKAPPGATPAALAHGLRLGWREAWAEPVPLAGTFLTFAVLVSIWASVWRLLPPATLARVSLTYAQVIWYFTLTEIVAFSLGHTYRRVQEEIESRAVTAFLVRPVSYVALTVAQELGHTTARVAAVIGPGALLAFGLTGTVPFGAAAIVPLVALLVGGAALYLAAQILIGLSTAWFGTARPVFFITQKLVFVFGGLILPLGAYPAVLQRISYATPFPAMLFAPASIALDSSFEHVVAMLCLQGLWLAVAVLALALASVAFERRLVHGGLT
jgi:ABC-2 type transport system permease protein